MKAFNLNSPKTGTLLLFCSANNTLISLLNSESSLLFTISCGHLQYKNSKKSTQIASQQLIAFFVKKILVYGYQQVSVKVKGIGKGRSFAIKELKKGGLRIIKILDNTPLAFNGCRVKKCKK
jgi:small subunit ribosomal protein S11